jgi:hypothetical protein
MSCECCHALARPNSFYCADCYRFGCEPGACNCPQPPRPEEKVLPNVSEDRPESDESMSQRYDRLSDEAEEDEARWRKRIGNTR